MSKVSIYLRQGVRKEEEDRQTGRKTEDRQTGEKTERDSSGEVSRQTGGERSADRWAE